MSGAGLCTLRILRGIRGDVEVFPETIVTILLYNAVCTFRRQIDITSYQIRKIKADTSFCLFADDLLDIVNTFYTILLQFTSMIKSGIYICLL